MEKNAKIYVAGHRGLVGSAILRRLKSEGYGNIIFRTREELDLTRQLDVYTFFEREKPEYVFLAAARVGGIIANNTYPAEFIYSNLSIQTNVIHAAYESGVKKLLFLGSSCIYPKFAPQPMKEEHLLTGVLEPTNEPYSIAKIAGIKMCQAYNRQYGTNFISVMPTNLYGPGDNFNLETSHVLPAIIRKFHLAKLLREKRGDEIRRDIQRFSIGFNLNPNLNFSLKEIGITSEYVTLWGTGSARREFIHVDDLADACVFLMQNYNDSEIINIGTGKDITIKELAELIKEIVGFKGEIAWDTTKPDGTPRKLLDVSRLKDLGWKPKIPLRDGIKMAYEWYCSSIGVSN
jgi:GDP-L-fucose synthase